jgi:hypothetical protein
LRSSAFKSRAFSHAMRCLAVSLAMPVSRFQLLQ